MYHKILPSSVKSFRDHHETDPNTIKISVFKCDYHMKRYNDRNPSTDYQIVIHASTTTTDQAISERRVYLYVQSYRPPPRCI